MSSSSDRQIAANRRNARRSTGPQTKEGRAASAKNALKHGLSVSGVHDPDQQKHLESWIKAFGAANENGASPVVVREAAEQQVRLQKIRAIKRDAMAHGLTAVIEGEVSGRSIKDSSRRSKALFAYLVTLDSYERKALSRRNGLLRKLTKKKFGETNPK